MKLNKFIVLTFIIFVFNCKTDSQNNKTLNKSVEKTEIITNQVENEKIQIDTNLEKKTKKLSLKLLQGIWYGEKDINMSKAYRVINKNKVLEIICVEGVCDGSNNFTHLEFGYIGFIDSLNKKTTTIKNFRINNLNNKGKYLVYVYNVEQNKLPNIVHYDKNYIYDSNLNFYKTTLSSNYMTDAIYYGRFNKEDTTAIFYRKNNLNNIVFNFLKTQSKKDQRNYIKEYNIKGFSQKIKVTADKTYFYNDEELKDKRKAFLVKGDIAYLENVGEKEVQVYFDGKVVTAGYLNKDDVQILK